MGIFVYPQYKLSFSGACSDAECRYWIECELLLIWLMLKDTNADTRSSGFYEKQFPVAVMIHTGSAGEGEIP